MMVKDQEMIVRSMLTAAITGWRLGTLRYEYCCLGDHQGEDP